METWHPHPPPPPPLSKLVAVFLSLSREFPLSFFLVRSATILFPLGICAAALFAVKIVEIAATSERDTLPSLGAFSAGRVIRYGTRDANDERFRSE